ncbi:hypothetical protein AYJ10_12690 [Serratia marcescens]|nr:hypothetical protein AYJ10_12690 [Serratia marcescens]
MAGITSKVLPGRTGLLAVCQFTPLPLTVVPLNVTVPVSYIAIKVSLNEKTQLVAGVQIMDKLWYALPL